MNLVRIAMNVIHYFMDAFDDVFSFGTFFF